MLTQERDVGPLREGEEKRVDDEHGVPARTRWLHMMIACEHTFTQQTWWSGADVGTADVRQQHPGLHVRRLAQRLGVPSNQALP